MSAAGGAAVAASRRRAPTGLRSVLEAWSHLQTKVGVIITLLIVIVAVAGPYLAPYAHTEFVDLPFANPSADAWFGTDNLGRDVLTRVLYGGRTVVVMSFLSVVVGMVLGIAFGLVAGYSRTWLDDVLMGTTDIVLAFPHLLLTLLFVAMAGPHKWLIVLLVAVGHAPRIARLTRGLTLDASQLEYVEAAEAMALPRWRILAGEILPNLSTPLMVEFGVRLAISVGMLAALSFLGAGLQPPEADWGLMINENRSALNVQPWSVVVPMAVISLFALGAYLISEGFARALAGVDRQGARA